jgi:hypothetical protein
LTVGSRWNRRKTGKYKQIEEKLFWCGTFSRTRSTVVDSHFILPAKDKQPSVVLLKISRFGAAHPSAVDEFIPGLRLRTPDTFSLDRHFQTTQLRCDHGLNRPLKAIAIRNFL